MTLTIGALAFKRDRESTALRTDETLLVHDRVLVQQLSRTWTAQREHPAAARVYLVWSESLQKAAVPQARDPPTKSMLSQERSLS